MNWEEKKKELNKQIELSCGFGELRLNLKDLDEMKEEKDYEETERQEKVGKKLPHNTRR